MTNPSQLAGQPVTLVFRTVHIDRGGQTGSTTIVNAEIAGRNERGDAVLISDRGIHLVHPFDQIFFTDGPDGYLGGHEVIRDFHNAIRPLSCRWLNERELREELTAASGDADDSTAVP